MDKKVQKSRHLSIFNYLDALQLEYIQSQIRRKIYPKQKDKRFFDRVLDNKKSKIEDIATRNGLPSIFRDDTLFDGYRERIVEEWGIPSFFYKDEADRAEFEMKDFRYYFSKGSEIKVKLNEEGESGIATINISPKLGEDVVDVQLRGTNETLKVSIKHIVRIL